MSTVTFSLAFAAAPTLTVELDPDPISAVEAALQTWAVRGSGLDADHVVWAREGYGPDPVPTGTYISLRLKNIDSVSDDWLISRRVGTQIVHHSRGTRHPTLEVTCVAGGRYGSSRAQMILARFTAALELPSVQAALRAGAVGVGTFGPVRVVEGRRSGLFDPRAIVEIDLHIGVDVSEVGAEFRTAEVTTPGPITSTVTHP